MTSHTPRRFSTTLIWHAYGLLILAGTLSAADQASPKNEPPMRLVPVTIEPAHPYARTLDLFTTKHIKAMPTKTDKVLGGRWNSITRGYLGGAAAKINEGYVGEYLPKWLITANWAVERTGDKDLLRILTDTADALIAGQEPDGYIGTYNEQKKFKGWDTWNQIHVLQALSELNRQFPDRGYGAAAIKEARVLAEATLTGTTKVTLFGGLPNHWLMGPLANVPGALEDPLLKKTLEQEYQQRIPALPLPAAGSPYLPLKSIHGAKSYETLQAAWAGLLAGRALGHPERGLQHAFATEQLFALSGISPTGSPWGKAEHTGYSDADPVYMMEVCAFMTWIRLNAELLTLTGDAKYAERIEVTLYNQMMASSSGCGDKVGHHLSSLLLPHTKPESRGSFGGCCSFSHGMALEELPRIAGGMLDRALVVNLFLPGVIKATTPSGPAAVTIAGDLTVEGSCTLTTTANQTADLLVRIPTWLEKPVVKRKGAVVDPPRERGYWRFAGPFQSGEAIAIAGNLPMRVQSLPWRLNGDNLKTNPVVNGGFVRRGPVVYGVLIRREQLDGNQSDASKLTLAQLDATIPYQLPASDTLEVSPSKEALPYAGPVFTWKTPAGEATLVPYWQAAQSDATHGISVLLRRAGEIPVAVPAPVLIPAGGRGPLEVQAGIIKGELPAGATLTYTLDGSDPAPTSTPWPDKVKVASGQVLKARWFQGGNAGTITTVSPLP